MPQYLSTDPHAGLESGNIDLTNRPRVQNPDGTVSTVRSISINEDGQEILIPTVSDDGRVLSDKDAIALYHNTGRHLGKFANVDEATRAAESIHNDQAASLKYLSNDPHAGTDKPDMFSWEHLKDAAYKSSPLPLFERKNLPMTMGGVGAGVGGPAGAAIGGAAGAALRDILGAATGAEDVPTTGTEAFANVAGNAALQGGLSAIPGVLRGAGTRLYGGLLKPAKALKESFGGSEAIVEPLLERAIPITRGGEQRIGEAVTASRGKALNLVRAADEAGAPLVEPQEIIREFQPTVTTLRKRVDIGQPSELPKVGARGRALVKTTDRGLPVTRAQELKEEAQHAASGAYRMQERGTAKQLSADDLLDEDTARGLRLAIEKRVPGVGPQNQETQRLLGPMRAMEDAVERERNNNAIGGGRDWAALGAGSLGLLGGGPAGAAGSAAIMRALATPSTGSMAAIAAYQAGRLPLDQLLRALAIEGELMGQD
jgi:hypothetical protein